MKSLHSVLKLLPNETQQKLHATRLKSTKYKTHPMKQYLLNEEYSKADCIKRVYFSLCD